MSTEPVAMKESAARADAAERSAQKEAPFCST